MWHGICKDYAEFGIMPEYASISLNMPEHDWTLMNVPEYAWLCQGPQYAAIQLENH